MTGGPDETIGRGEAELLIDGLTDDVAFVRALVHLGFRTNPPASDEPPSVEVIDRTFEGFERLETAGLIAVGRVEYLDPTTPPATVAPVRHRAEPIDLVRARVRRACASATDWAFACWIVNTEAGDLIAQSALRDGQT